MLKVIQIMLAWSLFGTPAKEPLYRNPFLIHDCVVLLGNSVCTTFSKNHNHSITPVSGVYHYSAPARPPCAFLVSVEDE